MEQSLLFQTLSRTPPWVFAVFIVLVLLGYQQSRERVVGSARLMLLPAAMLCYSLYGVGSSFGLAMFPLAAWVGGFVCVVVLGVRVLRPKGVVYSAAARSFRVPGSWLPLAAMMTIFAVKYLAGFAFARDLALVHQPWFIGSVSLALGLLSGVFSARAIAIWHACREAVPDRMPSPGNGNALELKVPPVPLAMIFGGAMWLASVRLPAFALALPEHLAVACILGGLGVICALAGIVAFRHAMTTFNPMQPGAAAVLVTSGVYRLSRNPMYVGLLFALGGWAVFLSHALGFLFLPAFVAYMNRFQIAPEEKALSSKFGEDFVAYQRSVRRWL